VLPAGFRGPADEHPGGSGRGAGQSLFAPGFTLI